MDSKLSYEAPISDISYLTLPRAYSPSNGTIELPDDEF